MKAVRLHEFGRPLKVEEVPEPKPGPNDVLISVKVSSICGTDLSIRAGRYPAPIALPRIMGHEQSGVVVEIGSEVKRLKVGDRVSSGCVVGCGACANCCKELEFWCTTLPSRFCGGDFEGSFADFMVMPERVVWKLPDELSFEEGSVLTDALATPYGAMKTADLRPGETVAIFGAGGLGLCSVQLAKVFGSTEVIAVDLLDHKLAMAKELGADEVINAQATDPVARIRSVTNGGVDVAFVLVGSEQAMQQALASVGFIGRVVLVGLGAQTLSVDPFSISYKKTTIMGHMGYPSTDFPVLMDLVRTKRINLQPIISHRLGFPSEVNRGMDLLQNDEGHPRRIAIVHD
jgi:alcohol dehydrogenase, propanol-preferring